MFDEHKAIQVPPYESEQIQEDASLGKAWRFKSVLKK